MEAMFPLRKLQQERISWLVPVKQKFLSVFKISGSHKSFHDSPYQNQMASGNYHRLFTKDAPSPESAPMMSSSKSDKECGSGSAMFSQNFPGHLSHCVYPSVSQLPVTSHPFPKTIKQNITQRICQDISMLLCCIQSPHLHYSVKDLIICKMKLP